MKPGDSPISIAEETPSESQAHKICHQSASNSEQAMDKKKDLTLVEQPAAYGQHLHEGSHQRRREIDHIRETRNPGTDQTTAPKTSKNQSVRSSNRTRLAAVIHLAPPPYDLQTKELINQVTRRILILQILANN